MEKADAGAVHQCGSTAARLADGGGWIVDSAESVHIVDLFETLIH